MAAEKSYSCAVRSQYWAAWSHLHTDYQVLTWEFKSFPSALVIQHITNLYLFTNNEFCFCSFTIDYTRHGAKSVWYSHQLQCQLSFMFVRFNRSLQWATCAQGQPVSQFSFTFAIYFFMISNCGAVGSCWKIWTAPLNLRHKQDTKVQKQPTAALYKCDIPVWYGWNTVDAKQQFFKKPNSSADMAPCFMLALHRWFKTAGCVYFVHSSLRSQLTRNTASSGMWLTVTEINIESRAATIFLIAESVNNFVIWLMRY